MANAFTENLNDGLIVNSPLIDSEQLLPSMHQTGNDIMSIAMKRRFLKSNSDESSTMTKSSKRAKLSAVPVKHSVTKDTEVNMKESCIRNENMDEVDGGSEFDIQTFCFSTEHNFGSDSVGGNADFEGKPLSDIKPTTEIKLQIEIDRNCCADVTAVNETIALKSKEPGEVIDEIGSESPCKPRSEMVMTVTNKHKHSADENIQNSEIVGMIETDSDSSSSSNQLNRKSTVQTTPRIVMFNGSEDDSNSNPFAISFFESLNEPRSNDSPNAVQKNNDNRETGSKIKPIREAEPTSRPKTEPNPGMKTEPNNRAQTAYNKVNDCEKQTSAVIDGCEEKESAGNSLAEKSDDEHEASRTSSAMVKRTLVDNKGNAEDIEYDKSHQDNVEENNHDDVVNSWVGDLDATKIKDRKYAAEHNKDNTHETEPVIDELGYYSNQFMKSYESSQTEVENSLNENTRSSRMFSKAEVLGDKEHSSIACRMKVSKVNADVDEASSKYSVHRFQRGSVETRASDNIDTIRNISRSSGKKSSRKQNVPKRHLHVTPDVSDDLITESKFTPPRNEVMGGNLHSEVYHSCFDNKKEIKMEFDDGNESQDHMVVAMNFEPTNAKHSSEKSRKQRKPQKLDRSAPHNNSLAINRGNTETESSGCNAGNQNLDKVDDIECVSVSADRTGDSDVDESELETEEGDFNEDRDSMSYEGSLAQVQALMGGEWPKTPNASQTLFQQQMLRMNMPFTNAELLSKLTPEQNSPDRSSLNISLNETSNIEVIRQLREIRCSRYRKITMAEKREIADYAKLTGISQAASVYNVSKSAVSMWTRMDLDQREDTDMHKKRNCMLGNERFEMLCARVRSLREKKFKGMSKSEKYEVSRYAKLVGVREMSRCVGVALGTVSGWVRQFPTKPEVNASESTQTSSAKPKRGKSSKCKSEAECLSEKSNDSLYENETSLKQGDDSMLNVPSPQTFIVKTENEETYKSKPKMPNKHDKSKQDMKDEVDVLLAENVYKPPDIDQLFVENHHLIVGTPLEGDEDFKELVKRVLANKVDKFKRLASSDKMAVVKHGKQVGLRRIGKIMGLSTGTLSGWNVKYQDFLNTTDTNMTERILSQLEPSCSPSMRKSDWSFTSLDQSIGGETTSDMKASYSQANRACDSPLDQAQAAVVKTAEELDKERSEVASVKCLFKEKFDEIRKKIEIARTMKFKNITPSQKIEIVKCSKLVGIRPTARVLKIPIGTLSGWISKYSIALHPAYNIGQEGMLGNSLNLSPSQMGLSGDFNYSGLDSVNALLDSGTKTSSSSQDSHPQSFCLDPSSPSSSSIQVQGQMEDSENSDENKMSVAMATTDSTGSLSNSDLEEEAKILAQKYVNTARFTF